MKFLGFDLMSLFKAPVVTEEPEIPHPQTPMPGLKNVFIHLNMLVPMGAYMH